MDKIMYMRCIGEFVATVLVICLGCLGCIGPDNSRLQISLHNGLVALFTIHCFGFVSGAHANPCISVACWSLNYITGTVTVMYIAAQFLGAFVGYYILMQIAPQDAVDGLCLAKPNGSLSNGQLMGVEFMVTGTLLLGWCAMWDVRGSNFMDSISLRIGLIVTACTLAAGPLTGASMNPVKLLAPAFFNDSYDKVHVFITSQVLATVVVPVVWQKVFSPRIYMLFASITKDNCSIDSAIEN